MDKILTYYDSLNLKIHFYILNLEKLNLRNLKDIGKFCLIKNFFIDLTKWTLKFMHIHKSYIFFFYFPK